VSFKIVAKLPDAHYDYIADSLHRGAMDVLALGLIALAAVANKI
jgi:hypothetical protein